MIPIRDHNPSSTFPLVNYLLIFINVAVFIYMFLLPSLELDNFIFQYALIPSQVSLSSLITSQFLHAGIAHILGNMLFLHVFGENLEDRLGHLKYLIYYLLCGIFAALTQYFISPYSHIPVLGASGAIAGIMGGYLILFPKARIDVLLPLGIFFPMITVSAFTMLLYWIVVQFISGFGSLGVESGGIAYFAHIGGFIAGIILIWLFPKKSPLQTQIT